MMDMATAAMLTKYNAWADQILFDALAKLPQDAVYRQSGTLFKSIVGTLNHNYQVDLIWQANLCGRDHGFTSRRDVLHPEFAALVTAQNEMNQWYIDWAATQSTDNLEEIVPFRFVSGKQAEMQKGAILFHVINHKSYHRGWVAEMFFDAGSRPPAMDITVYLCET